MPQTQPRKSHNLAPARHELDRIEIASRDEIMGLQLERLRWTVRHVWGNVPYQRARFEAAGAGPDANGIERSLGKARRVVDKRPKD
jgi:phenylacetate-coenzyme A ligase PaaK-like adenylate-forming protein